MELVLDGAAEVHMESALSGESMACSPELPVFRIWGN